MKPAAAMIVFLKLLAAVKQSKASTNHYVYVIKRCNIQSPVLKTPLNVYIDLEYRNSET